MRSFKPALARDYDVFFAAIGLLCGGILFFQGWRLDPILQFGQFLLAGTTVFFAYESVRLRGIATDQARKSSYFDDDSSPPRMQNGEGFENSWNDQYSRFDPYDESRPNRRRFSASLDNQEEELEGDIYRPRRTSRAAIPERAASRRNRRGQNDWDENSERSRRIERFGAQQDERRNLDQPNFGERRTQRQEQRRGSRPIANEKDSNIRIEGKNQNRKTSSRRNFSSEGVPQGSRIRREAEDAAFSPATIKESQRQPRQSSRPSRNINSAEQSSTFRKGPIDKAKPRDNNSRFDD